jgi:hypothetical protein
VICFFNSSHVVADVVKRNFLSPIWHRNDRPGTSAGDDGSADDVDDVAVVDFSVESLLDLRSIFDIYCASNRPRAGRRARELNTLTTCG